MTKSWKTNTHLTLVWLASLSFFVPQIADAAVGGPLVRNRINRNAPALVVDVALADQGVLQGRVSDASGAARDTVTVVVRRDSETLAVTTTDANGHFFVRGLSAGVYEIVTNGVGRIVRVWAPGTAPPVAARAIDLRTGPDVVRGNFSEDHLRRAAIIAGVIGTAGVLGGVIGYNIRDNDAS